MSQINISFDYLSKNEGAVIQLLHTGISEEDIEIHGIIKDSGKTPKHINDTFTLNLFYIILLVFIFSFPVFIFVISAEEGTIFVPDGIKIIASFFIFFWGIGCLLVFRHFLPKDLNKFEEEILK